MSIVRSPAAVAAVFTLFATLAVLPPSSAAALSKPAVVPTPPAPVVDPDGNHPAVKTITTLIGAVRYGKHVLGLTFMDGSAQGAFMLGDNWLRGDDRQRAEFITLFHTVFAKVAFPKMQKNFQNIQTAVYDPPVVTGNRALVKSTLVVLHALKKQEYKLKYQLILVGADWKLVDVEVLGESMLTGVRNEQIAPILKEGGWPKLLDLLRQKAKSLEGVVLK